MCTRQQREREGAEFIVRERDRMSKKSKIILCLILQYSNVVSGCFGASLIIILTNNNKFLLNSMIISLRWICIRKLIYFEYFKRILNVHSTAISQTTIRII